MSASPLAIAHPREASSFLELSPGSPLSPSPSSSSSSLSSTGAFSPTLSDFALPPADPWRTAEAEAAAGIQYTWERFPTPGSVLAPPFRNEPLTVGPDTRVLLLDDGATDDADAALHRVRVRVLETGETGVIPTWILECPLERLARLNMEFNEAATCPEERKLASRKTQSAPDLSTLDVAASEPSASAHAALYAPLAHQHDHCKPFRPQRRRYHGFPVSPAADEDEVDDPFGLAEEEDDGALTVRRKDAARRKSVGFADVVRPKVFRYPSAALVAAYYGEADEESQQGDVQEDEEEWWWAGWEEQRGSDDESFMDCE